MPSSWSNPSILVRSWFNVCSLSSLPPELNPYPLLPPIASISSINITHGLFCFAVSNKLLTRDAPTPTNISINEEPVADINDTPASPATARAINVLPVPGGPSKRIPFGTLAPATIYLSGLCK